MPGIIMHDHFAKIVHLALDEEVKNYLDNDLYLFASQGPDIFEYKSIFSKNNFKKNKELWERAHNIGFKDFLINLLEKAKLNKDLFPYLCGNITHYYLDAITNSYIIHKTGLYRPSINNSIKYRGLIEKMFKAMDSYILENYYSANPNTFNFRKKILKLNKLPKTIIQDINILYKESYNIDNGYKYINDCIKGEKLFYFLLFDPLGIKNKIFTNLDNGKSIVDYKFLSFYNKSLDIRKYDIFNFKHDRWFNPADDTITSIDSFFDLMEKAKKITISAINDVYKYVYLDEEIDFNKYFLDVSLITGLKYNENVELKYFNSIFK